MNFVSFTHISLDIIEGSGFGGRSLSGIGEIGDRKNSYSDESRYFLFLRIWIRSMKEKRSLSFS